MIRGKSRIRYYFFVAFVILSFLAVAAGCLTAALGGVPAGVWIRDLAAWCVGAVVALAVSRFASPGFARVTIFAAPVGLLLSLVNPGQTGVHRWIDAGPVHANAAALLLPAFVVATAVLVRDTRWIWIAYAVCGISLIAQPDASQATAFAAAALVVVVRLPVTRPVRIGVAVLALSGAGITWLRPDPLTPVAEVEGVIGLAYGISPLIAILAVFALGGTTLVPAMISAGTYPLAVRTAALALGAYFAVSAITPLFGAFPVPLVGMSISPIFGFWLGAGLLVALVSWEDDAGDSNA